LLCIVIPNRVFCGEESLSRAKSPQNLFRAEPLVPVGTSPPQIGGPE